MPKDKRPPDMQLLVATPGAIVTETPFQSLGAVSVFHSFVVKGWFTTRKPVTKRSMRSMRGD